MMDFEEFAKTYALTTGQIISNEHAVAKLAWDAALEEAAKLCQSFSGQAWAGGKDDAFTICAKAIRARGKAPW